MILRQPVQRQSTLRIASMTWASWLGITIEQSRSGNQHSGRTCSALRGSMLQEACRNRAPDCEHCARPSMVVITIFGLCRWHQARAHWFTIQQIRGGATISGVTSDFGPGKPQVSRNTRESLRKGEAEHHLTSIDRESNGTDIGSDAQFRDRRHQCFSAARFFVQCLSAYGLTRAEPTQPGVTAIVSSGSNVVNRRKHRQSSGLTRAPRAKSTGAPMNRPQAEPNDDRRPNMIQPLFVPLVLDLRHRRAPWQNHRDRDYETASGSKLHERRGGIVKRSGHDHCGQQLVVVPEGFLPPTTNSASGIGADRRLKRVPLPHPAQAAEELRRRRAMHCTNSPWDCTSILDLNCTHFAGRLFQCIKATRKSGARIISVQVASAPIRI